MKCGPDPTETGEAASPCWQASTSRLSAWAWIMWMFSITTAWIPTPLEETMGALAQAVRSGKALYVGLSNYDGKTLQEACAILERLDVSCIINQNRCSILDRTSETNCLLETSWDLNKGIIAFSLLAKGQLTDRYLYGIPEDSHIRTDGRFLKESDLPQEKVEERRALNVIAAARGEDLSVMALRRVLESASPTQDELDQIERHARAIALHRKRTSALEHIAPDPSSGAFFVCPRERIHVP